MNFNLATTGYKGLQCSNLPFSILTTKRYCRGLSEPEKDGQDIKMAIPEIGQECFFTFTTSWLETQLTLDLEDSTFEKTHNIIFCHHVTKCSYLIMKDIRKASQKE